jgi:Family of unknown function (DUF6035)
MVGAEYRREPVGVAPAPVIKEVHDCRAGRIRPVSEILPADSECLHVLRREIVHGVQQGSPLFLCAYCAKPIYLALESLRKRSGLHFRHYSGDGDCTARTRNGWDTRQIDARKYDGLKEGSLHLETKELLAASLSADPYFSDVQIEKRWTNIDGHSWRQPDVQARFCGRPTVFEIQLATTFLSVIEARAQFYQRENATLVWVFRSFDTEHRRAAIDDIYFANNRNGFVVDGETRDISVANHKMMLRCFWPAFDEVRQLETWRDQVVAFDDLTSDPRGRVWYFDCDTERKNREPSRLKILFREICDGYVADQQDAQDARWLEIHELSRGLGTEINNNERNRLRKLVSALFGLETGKVVGFRYAVLVSIAHYFYDKYKPLLYYFLHGENAYGHRDAFARAGRDARWAKRREEAVLGMRRGDSPFSPDKSYQRLVCALFPEIELEIRKTKLKRESSREGL